MLSSSAEAWQGARSAGLGKVLKVEPSDVYLKIGNQSTVSTNNPGRCIPLVIKTAIRDVQPAEELPYVVVRPINNGIDTFEGRPPGIGHIPM